MRRVVLVLAAIGLASLLVSGVAIAATIQGTTGPDVITGTAGNDNLDGNDGDDTISGLEGSDTIDGGKHNDKLYGEDDNRDIPGGDDTIKGGFGVDTIWGGPGADNLQGGADNDTIYAGPWGEMAVDTVYGSDGDDTIYTANLPASKDVIYCGLGTADEVVVDSLDQVVSGCEKVEKIQEQEPRLAAGTYRLVPDPSSHCNLGEGTVTIAPDPESGDRSAQVKLGEEVPKDAGVRACSVEIDYQTVTSTQTQGGVSAQSQNTLTYEGAKPSQQEIDTAINGTQQPDLAVKEEGSTSPPSGGEVSAQYAWNGNKYTNVVLTRDPVRIKLTETRHTLRWWHNGSTAAYNTRSGSCWADNVTAANTYWYTYDCFFTSGAYFGGSGEYEYIGSEVVGKYYNYNFWSNYYVTRVRHSSLIKGYENGGVRWDADWYFSGEAWWLLRGDAYGFYSY